MREDRGRGRGGKKPHGGLTVSGEAAAKQSQKPFKHRTMKGPKPLPDGNIAYVHIVNPVVKGADYTIMQALYDAYPDQRQALYELYRGAFAQSLALATGSVAVDLSSARP